MYNIYYLFIYVQYNIIRYMHIYVGVYITYNIYIYIQATSFLL